MSLTWTAPVWMWPLLLVLAAGAVIWTVHVYGRTRPSPRPGLGRVLILLRSGAIILLVIAVGGPVLSRFLRQEIPGRLVFVFEDSGSMGIADGPAASGDSTANSTRWESALGFAAAIDSALERSQWPGAPVFLRGNGMSPLKEFRLDDPVIPDPASHGTDLNRLTRQVADHTVGSPARAVILLSDGQETSSATGGAPLAASLPGSGPLLVVGAGDPVGSADRLIRDLRYPDTAYAGDEILVELAVTHRFLSGETVTPVTVSLTENGAVIAEEVFEIAGETTHLEFPFKAPEEGLRVFELQVSPLVNERFLANNKLSMAINVRRGRSRVLLLADRPGWDLRFLAQAALSEPRVDLSVVYPTAAGPVFADSLVSWSEPATAEQWNQWDGVILLGWGRTFANLDWQKLDGAVKEGLGLWVLAAGPDPQQNAMLPPPAGLAELLPVSATRFRYLEGSFFASAPTGGTGHPVLHLVAERTGRPGDSAAPAGALAALPPLRRIVGVAARPGALVLLEGMQRGGGTQGVKLPLLVLNNREQGRVVWFGGQQLWELAFWEPGLGPRQAEVEGIQAARRLMQNLLVWLAAGQEESGLVFSGRRAFYQEGERINLAAQWRDMRGQPVQDRSLSLVLRARDGEQGGAERTFAMSPSPGNPGLAEVDLPPLPPGNYSIRLVGQGDPPVLGAEEFLVVTTHSIEDTQVRQDQRRLGQLASLSGGSYHSLDQAQVVENVMAELSRLDWSAGLEERRARLDFWKGWPFLVLVVALLGLEWFLRRRNGLL
jgi:hypothetical protein